LTFVPGPEPPLQATETNATAATAAAMRLRVDARTAPAPGNTRCRDPARVELA
jgi:hypothetical protein